MFVQSWWSRTKISLGFIQQKASYTIYWFVRETLYIFHLFITADSGGASHIAIFCTNCIPVFDLIPGYAWYTQHVLCLYTDLFLSRGFVRNADEIPVWVGFKGNRGNGSTLVTVSNLLIIIMY